MMVPPLSQKKNGQFLLILLIQGLSRKVFFLIFEPILRAGFVDKMLTLSSKKSICGLVSGFLAVVLLQFCSQIVLKVAF